MRALSSPALIAIDAVITSPGHLVELALSPTPARWSDIGQVTLSDGRTFAAVDMEVSKLSFSGDSAPGGITLKIGNLDSAIAALLLANDLAAVPLHVYGYDRAAIALADIVPLGIFNISSATIGLDSASIDCAPILYTAPFRRVDPSFGFKFATPAGTKIMWGQDAIVLDRETALRYNTDPRWRGF